MQRECYVMGAVYDLAMYIQSDNMKMKRQSAHFLKNNFIIEWRQWILIMEFILSFIFKDTSGILLSLNEQNRKVIAAIVPLIELIYGNCFVASAGDKLNFIENFVLFFRYLGKCRSSKITERIDFINLFFNRH